MKYEKKNPNAGLAQEVRKGRERETVECKQNSKHFQVETDACGVRILCAIHQELFQNFLNQSLIRSRH